MRLAELTTIEVQRISREVVVLFPIAALEQHSDHLPVFTDSLLCGAVADGVEKNLPKDVLLLPVQWHGASSHHMGFAGTITVDLYTHVDMIVQTLKCMLAHGFNNLFVLNGHGGNQDTMQVALRRLAPDYPNALIAAASYWDIAGATIAKRLKGPRKVVGHAGEMETSLMLAVRPDLVRKSRIKDDPPQDDSRLTGVFVPLDMRRHTRRGSVGYASEATAPNGKRLLAEIIEEVTAAVSAVQKGASRGKGRVQSKRKRSKGA